MDIKGAIPDLDWLLWAGRPVVIAYDADADTKELVRIARSALAAHLRGHGALVGFLEWDIERGKGIDDHLAAVGPDMVLNEIAHVDFAGFQCGWPSMKPEADEERVDQLRRLLRDELREGGITTTQVADSNSVPTGAKGAEVLSLGRSPYSYSRSPCAS
jgi:hypothetical protein